MVTALRTPASVSIIHRMQPVWASSEYRSPSQLPAYTRPPNTTGCALAEVAPGNPNAHFNLRRGTSSGDRRAAAAGWNRVFCGVTPQPFQDGPGASLENASGLWQNADF